MKAINVCGMSISYKLFKSENIKNDIHVEGGPDVPTGYICGSPVENNIYP